jgi:fatty acid synthase
VLANCLTYEPNYEEFLKNLFKTIKMNGFVIIVVRTSLTIPEKFLLKIKESNLLQANNIKELLKICSDVGFKMISTKTFSSFFTTILLRKTPEVKINNPMILRLRPENFDWVENLQSKIKEIEDEPESRKIWLIGNGAVNGIIGFINCLRKEDKGDRIRCLFDMDGSLPEDIESLNKKIKEISQLDLVFNVWHNGILGTFRHLTIEKNLMKPIIDSKKYYLNILKRGELNTLRWFPISSDHCLESKNIQREKQISIAVSYAAINEKDIDIIYNRYPIDSKFAKHECLIGQEFSGIRKDTGKPVMGIKFSGSISSDLVTHEDLLFKIPGDWSLAESAAVPLNYFTCYYALFLKGNLREKETIFIRFKNFCFSLAAISICLSRKCQVFVKTEDDNQEKILMDRFGVKSSSQLIFIRNDISFKNQILNQTNGRGIDLLLSWENEQCFDECMECLKNGGTYLELNKKKIIDNEMFPSIKFRRNISFHVIDLDYILRYFDHGFKSNPTWERQVKEVHNLFIEGLKNGEIRPFGVHLFKVNQFREAVQISEYNRNLNSKNIIEIREKSQKPDGCTVKVTGRCSFSSSKTYIITGGLGGFGFELSKWLFERGARNLILTSRNGPKNSVQTYFLNHFNEIDGHVEVSNLDVTDEKEAISLIERAEKLGPLGGIFHLALVLMDGLFENQTSVKFEQVNKAKYDGLINLDKITRSRKIDLDYFVAFSSISSGRGNPGQSNYGFSNSCIERICEQRRKNGLHGMAIQWGPIDDVGVLIEINTNIKEGFKLNGLVPQRMPTCFAVLDYFLSLPQAVLSSFTRGEIVSEKMKPKESLMDNLAAYLGVESKKIEDSVTLEDIGVDSLMSLEVQKRLEREYEKSIPLSSIKKIKIGQLRAVEKSNKSEFLNILNL